MQIIQVRHEPGPFETHEPVYEWLGAPGAPVYLTPRYLPDGLASLPWPVRRVDESPWDDAGLYVRTDVRWWRVTAARYALRRAWRWFTARAVLTLYVWGLADRDPAVTVTWSQVRWPWRRG